MANNLYSFTLQTVQVTTGTPETVVNDLVAQNPLGAIMKWNGNVYRYVKFDNGQGNVASTATGVLHWFTGGLDPSATAPLYTVTSDQTDALASINSIAGIGKGVITDAYFTFIGIGGVHSATCPVNTTIGNKMIGSATDLAFATLSDVATTTGIVFGAAMTTVNGGAGNVLLQNLIW